MHIEDHEDDHDNDHVHDLVTDGQDLKKILLFTPFFHMKAWGVGLGRAPFIKGKCPVNNCFVYNDINDKNASLGDYDALMFHMRNMNDGRTPIPNQKHRKPHQRYVMFIVESPMHDNFPYEKFKSDILRLSINLKPFVSF